MPSAIKLHMVGVVPKFPFRFFLSADARAKGSERYLIMDTT